MNFKISQRFPGVNMHMELVRRLSAEQTLLYYLAAGKLIVVD